MTKKITYSHIEKYDVSQKILRELVDIESRLVLFSIKTKAKTASEIFYITKVPLSTIYNKLARLQDLGLVGIEKRDFKHMGQPEKYFRSRISSAEISINKLEPKLILKKNEGTRTH